MLIATTLAVAVTLAYFRRFEPRVVIAPVATLGVPRDPSVESEPFHFYMQNNGPLPIWYFGKPSAEPRVRFVYDVENVSPKEGLLSHGSLKLTRLDKGDQVFFDIPHRYGILSIMIRIEVCDWRGRWEIIDTGSLPVVYQRRPRFGRQYPPSDW